MKRITLLLICLVVGLCTAMAGCQSKAEKDAVSKEDFEETTGSLFSEESILDEESSEASKNEKKIRIYLPVEGDFALTSTEVDFDGTHEGLIAAMASANALPKDVKLNFLRIDDGIAHVNLNKAFADYVYAGTFAQYYGIGCVVNTIIDCYDVNRVFITADGKILIGAEGDYFYKPNEYYGERDDKQEKQYAVLYLFDVNDMTFTPKPISFDGTPEGIVNALAKTWETVKGIELNSFSIKDGVAYADMNAAFGDLVYMGMFTEAEVDSLAYSLLSYYGMTEAESVFVTINGVPFESHYSGLEAEAIRFSPDMVLAK